jgi:hypothetical protein
VSWNERERCFLISQFLATDPEVFTKPGWQISFNPPSDPGCRVGPLLKFAAHIESSNDIAQQQINVSPFYADSSPPNASSQLAAPLISSQPETKATEVSVLHRLHLCLSVSAVTN